MPISADASQSPLTAALSATRRVFVGIGLITAVLNVLMLTGSFFMLEIYDRVIPSQSVPTLIGLCILAAALFLFQGLLDFLRSRILVRVGWKLDEMLDHRVYDTLIRIPLRAGARGENLQPLRDIDQIKAFLTSQGPTALFDLPWMPLYLGICFMFHFWLGMTAFIGGCILIVLTWLSDRLTRARIESASQLGWRRQALADASRRNAEVLHAMGMSAEFARRWKAVAGDHGKGLRAIADITGGMGALSKTLRIALQSAVLAVGAYLVISQQASAGIIIASSILTARALAPVEQAIANWRGFVLARQSWSRLTKLFAQFPERPDALELPRPKSTLAVEGVIGVPPGEQNVVLQDVTFRLSGGQGLGIVGPSASGKSSLVRLIVGVWQPARGTVRLDGATLMQMSPAILGRDIGYLPQDVELFDGTVAENIARFQAEPNPDNVIEAAKAAGIHDLILRLPRGYETPVGDNGRLLSAGQQQRVALARALYRDPFLVVLDEPNSNLDQEGEEALTKAILGVRARGGIVIVVAHRASALGGLDQLLVIAGGRMQALGPKDDVMQKIQQAQRSTPAVAPAFAVTPQVQR